LKNWTSNHDVQTPHIATFGAPCQRLLFADRKILQEQGRQCVQVEAFVHSCADYFWLRLAVLTECGLWWAALLIAVLHLVIDGLKSVCKNLKGAFFIDQLLHLAVIVAVVITFNNIGEISLPIWLPETKVLLWIVAFVFCLRPANFIIQNIFKEAKITIPDNGKEQSLPNAGRVIGNVERMLTLVFVMLGQYEAIGFLLAAKSLLRFREIDTVKSEYVLVGTLLSFGIAILMGVAVKLLIESNVIS
jgi:hypothetical protein